MAAEGSIATNDLSGWDAATPLVCRSPDVSSPKCMVIRAMSRERSESEDLMGFFKRRAKTQAVTMDVQIYTGSVVMDVGGESHYQHNLESIAGPKNEVGYNLAVDVVLIREPDNEFDSNAIAVYAAAQAPGAEAVKVGYVARETAVGLAPAIDRRNGEGETVGLEGAIRGGWDRGGDDVGYFGISLFYDPADFGV